MKIEHKGSENEIEAGFWGSAKSCIHSLSIFIDPACCQSWCQMAMAQKVWHSLCLHGL